MSTNYSWSAVQVREAKESWVNWAEGNEYLLRTSAAGDQSSLQFTYRPKRRARVIVISANNNLHSLTPHV